MSREWLRLIVTCFLSFGFRSRGRALLPLFLTRRLEYFLVRCVRFSLALVKTSKVSRY